MKNSIKCIIFIMIITLMLILCNLTLLLINHVNNEIKITLNGNNISLLLNEEYKEPGASASYCHNNKCIDISNKIKISSDLDNTKIGKYESIYTIEYNNQIKTISRNISVIEKIPPKINLTGSTEIFICPTNEYDEEGYTATDNYDGDITDKVEKTIDGNKIIYKVADSSGNITEVYRNIQYEDNTKPVITLKGNSNITLNIGEPYQESGYIAIDNCSGDITDKVTVTNNVDINKQGTYKIIYTVEDNNNNITSITRNVKVTRIPTFNTKDISEYKEALDNYIIANNYKVSVGYYNLATGESYLYKPNQIYYGASLVKTVNALYTYENMTLTSDIKSLVKIMISKSDNAAHLKLLDKIGYNNLKSYGRSIGAKNYLSGSDKYGNTTVNDQIAVWKYFYEYINNASNGKELSSYFINDFYNSLTYPGLPTTYHKYGWYSSYYHDTGIVLDNKPYIIVILTKHGKQNYQQIVNDLSKKIYQLNQLT